MDRELLLARTELRHKLLHLDALLFEGGNNVIHDVSRGIEANTAKAQAAVERLITAGRYTCQIKFVFHGCLHDHTHLRRTGYHALQEGAWASLPGLALQGDHITEHHGTVRDVGEHDKGAGIGYQAKLPNGPQPLDGCQGIHTCEGLHGERLADALVQAPG